MKYIVMAVLTAAFAVWLIASGQGAQVATALQAFPLPAVVLLFGGLALTYGLRALRVYHEFADATRGRFGACLRLVLTHNALVNLLPMRSGELAFPLLLQRQFGVPVLRAAASLLWLRAQDAVILGVLAVAAWPGLPLAVRVAGMLALAAGGALMAPIAQRLLARVPAGRFGRLGKLCAALADSAHHARIGWLWTLANWCVKLAVLSEVLALLLGATWGAGFAGAVGGELAAIMPVQGVAGIGSYEAGVAAALSLSDIAWRDGLAAAFSLHLLVLASALLAAGIALAVSARAGAVIRQPDASPDARNQEPKQEP